jgi:hypothetical protein
MQDVCEEVIRKLEKARIGDTVDVAMNFKGVSTSIYENDFFFYTTRLEFVPSHLCSSYNVVFSGTEFVAHPEVLQSVADSIAEDVRKTALVHGIQNAFMDSALVAKSGDTVLLKTASGHNMRNTSEAVLADIKRVKALAENLVRPVLP